MLKNIFRVAISRKKAVGSCCIFGLKGRGESHNLIFGIISRGTKLVDKDLIGVILILGGDRGCDITPCLLITNNP